MFLSLNFNNYEGRLTASRVGGFCSYPTNSNAEPTVLHLSISAVAEPTEQTAEQALVSTTKNGAIFEAAERCILDFFTDEEHNRPLG
jgi:hypothetical protein